VDSERSTTWGMAECEARGGQRSRTVSPARFWRCLSRSLSCSQSRCGVRSAQGDFDTGACWFWASTGRWQGRNWARWSRWCHQVAAPAPMRNQNTREGPRWRKMWLYGCMPSVHGRGWIYSRDDDSVRRWAGMVPRTLAMGCRRGLKQGHSSIEVVTVTTSHGAVTSCHGPWTSTRSQQRGSSRMSLVLVVHSSHGL